MKRLIIFLLLCATTFAIDGFLEQSTNETVILGPFRDSVDGVTAETGLTVTYAEVLLSKDGGAMAAKSETTSLGSGTAGFYTCLLNTTDTATLGILVIHVNESGAGQVTQSYMVVTSNVYDSIVGGTDKLQTHTTEMTAGVITSTVMATNSIGADEIADNSIDAGAIAANAIGSSEIGTYIATRTLAAANYFLYGTDTVANVSTVATLTGHTVQTGDSYAIVSSETHGNAALKTQIDTVDDYVDTEIADIIDKLKAIMSKAYTIVTAVGTFDPATDSLEAQQENPQAPPIFD